jgi:hypothetical protein
MPNKNHGRYFIGIAKDNDLEVVRGKGDHVKVKVPPTMKKKSPGRDFMIIPDDELSPGVKHAVIKWFLALGIVVPILLTFYMRMPK